MIVALYKKSKSTGLFYFVVQMYGNYIAEQFWTPGGVEVL